MSSSILKLSLCAAVMACVAGCGGSSSGSNNGGGGGGGGGGGNSNPTTVTYTFTGAAPAVVATQIGAGKYTQATLQSGKLTMTIPSGTTNYSVAFLCPTFSDENDLSSNTEQVIQAGTLDGTSFSEGCTATPTYGNATVQVDASAIPGAYFLQIGEVDLPWSTSVIDFSVGLPAGTPDVPVLVNNDDLLPVAAKILRSQPVPGALNGGNTIVFAASDELVPESVSYGTFPSGFTAVSLVASYETANGAEITLSYDNPVGYPAMPASAYQAGDYYILDIAAFGPANTGEFIQVKEFTSSAGPQSFTFPAAWSYAGPTAAALPTFNYDYTGFSGKADVLLNANLEWGRGTAVDNFLGVATSQNYLGGSTSIETPDLSGVPGFLAPPASGTTVNWAAFITQGNPFRTATPSGTEVFVQNNGSYTEP
jgi:hypothetical protein